MHDGSVVRFSKVAADYNPRDRQAAYSYLQTRQKLGEVPTGLLYFDDATPEMHATNDTTDVPLVQLPFDKLCPGSAALEALMEEFRCSVGG